MSHARRTKDLHGGRRALILLSPLVGGPPRGTRAGGRDSDEKAGGRSGADCARPRAERPRPSAHGATRARSARTPARTAARRCGSRRRTRGRRVGGVRVRVKTHFATSSAPDPPPWSASRRRGEPRAGSIVKAWTSLRPRCCGMCPNWRAATLTRARCRSGCRRTPRVRGVSRPSSRAPRRRSPRSPRAPVTRSSSSEYSQTTASARATRADLACRTGRWASTRSSSRNSTRGSPGAPTSGRRPGSAAEPSSQSAALRVKIARYIFAASAPGFNDSLR